MSGRHPTPKQIANLRPCKPGETHNPKGRPKGSLDFNGRMKRALLAQIKSGEFKGKQIIDVFVAVMQRQLLRGDVRWAQLIMERLEPVQKAAAAALGVQVNVSAGSSTPSSDIDLSGARIAAIVQVLRDCSVLDVSPVSVTVIDPGKSNGNGHAGAGGVLPAPTDPVHPPW